MTHDMFEEHPRSDEYLGIRLIPAPPRSHTYGPNDIDAIKRSYIEQWDKHVTTHHGKVLMKADVYVDGVKHCHRTYVVDHLSECDYCASANRREFKMRTAPNVNREELPKIRFVLYVERRTFPRQRIEVPMIAPTHRKGNARIQKKWNKKVMGKTVPGYRTEIRQISMTKFAMNVLRKELSEREARARRNRK